MRKTTRTEIHVETHEIAIIRYRDRQHAALCERCMAFTPTPDQPSDPHTEPDEIVRSAEEKNLDLRTTD